MKKIPVGLQNASKNSFGAASGSFSALLTSRKTVTIVEDVPFSVPRRSKKSLALAPKTVVGGALLFSCLLCLFGCAKIEQREVRWPNGQVKERYQVRVDREGREVKQGGYSSWYANGQKECEGAFQDGLKNGRWRGWYESGTKSYTGHYDRGLLAKQWIIWDEDGTVVYKGKGYGNKIYPSKYWWAKNKAKARAALPELLENVKKRKKH